MANSTAAAAWWQALKEADPEIYKKAAQEVAVIGIISLLPLLLASYGHAKLLPLINPDAEELSFWAILARAFLGGQLYFYAMSFVAAVVWHSGQDMKRPFPLRITFWAVAFILGSVCATFFGLSPALPNVLSPDVYIGSLLAYALAAVMYFLILAFHEIEPPDLEKMKAQDEASLTEKLRHLRGQE